MTENTPTPEELQAQIAELKEELIKVNEDAEYWRQADAAMYRQYSKIEDARSEYDRQRAFYKGDSLGLTHARLHHRELQALLLRKTGQAAVNACYQFYRAPTTPEGRRAYLKTVITDWNEALNSTAPPEDYSFIQDIVNRLSRKVQPASMRWADVLDAIERMRDERDGLMEILSTGKKKGLANILDAAEQRTQEAVRLARLEWLKEGDEPTRQVAYENERLRHECDLLRAGYPDGLSLDDVKQLQKENKRLIRAAEYHEAELETYANMAHGVESNG